MNRRIFSILVVLVLAVSSFGTVFADEGVTELQPEVAAPSAETGEMTNESSALWFVELSSAPTVDGTRLNTVRAEKATFRANARKVGLVYVEKFAFDTLWNGLSIEIGTAQLSKLSGISGVKAIYPVEIVRIPETTNVADPELATALAMTGADVAQSELGYTGDGIKVAVMDTGVDYHHPDLGGCFGAGCRVFTGYDFVGDAYNANPADLAYNPTPAPDADPDDCNGHGTHVSGIIGADGAVTGVAPGVNFGAYRVFGCAGSTTADIMLAAMERAYADDMDVLNMSIGSAFQWPQYPTAAASDRLVNKGMVVVASIGNSGDSGVYSAGSPGLGKKVIGVASYDNSHVQLTTFTVTPANITAGYGNAAGAPPAPTSGSLPLTKTAATGVVPPGVLPGNDGCAALPAGSLAGQAVLIRRGTCTFHTKALNAMNAGAAAVVLYNNAAGRFSPTVAGSPAITIPVVAISDTEGVAIHNALVSGPQTLNWQSGTGTFVNPTGGLISSFSSYGLSPDLALKPDIGAPGGLIRSTYPVELGSYATISGTSMSSPHVAGAAALYLEAHPGTSSQDMRDILQNSADPKNWWGNPGLGFLDNVHRQGAGMLDIDDAILATTLIKPGKIAAGEGEAGPFAQTLTLSNSSGSDVTYDLSFVNALSTGGVIAPSFSTSNATVTFSAPSVTVPAGGTASVDATINATTALNRQYGGYIVFTPQGGGQVYRVPFAGYSGDYQSIVVLTNATFPTGPLLAKLNSCTPAALLRGLDCFGAGSYGVLPAGDTFDLTAAVGETPYLLVHLDHQVSLLRMEVFDANTGKNWHRILNQQHVGRNSASNTFFAFPWNGQTTAGNKTFTVPDGQYVVKVSVLKALGDDANPAHWETWTSPVITIDRP